MFLINNHQATYINVKNSLKKSLKTTCNTVETITVISSYLKYICGERHSEISSVLLFNKPLCSALTIIAFSVRHRSHLLVQHLYCEARAAMLHLKLYTVFLSFNFNRH